MANSMAAGQRMRACETRYSTNPATPGAALVSAVFSPRAKRFDRL